LSGSGSGGNRFIKVGSGTLTLNGAYTGGSITINNGAICIGKTGSVHNSTGISLAEGALYSVVFGGSTTLQNHAARSQLKDGVGINGLTANLYGSGNPSDGSTVSMAWRASTEQEQVKELIASNVLMLSSTGNALSGGYALAMQYDPTLLSGGTEAELALGSINIKSYADGAWTRLGKKWLSAAPTTYEVGQYWVDTSADTVYVVTDKNSGTFAAVPEPNTIVMLAAGVLGLIAYAWRRRK
jgi:autotransporter-associated beta strand protein